MSKHVKDKEKANKIIMIVMTVVLILAFVAVLIVAALMKNTDTENQIALSRDSVEGSGSKEKWQEGLIEYKGKNYRYNNQLKIYLFMGIDSDGTVDEITDEEDGSGQSDALFLLVADPESKKVSVVSINRNTMTKIEVYSESGNSLGYYDLQICLQHAYGDNSKMGCQRTENAVSYLFYNLPIDGYLSINMGGIPLMNDSVGGVEVQILDDLTQGDITLKKGETRTLSGQEAYLYLRGRDTNIFDSATGRLRRQEQYIAGYLAKLKSTAAGDSEAVVSIYEDLSDYIVTNINVAEMAMELKDYTYDASSLYTVPGETVMGDKLEEYHVDEIALYELILQVFYREE